MRFSFAAILALSATLMLGACSSVDSLSSFPIAQGPLKADELKMDGYSKVAFAARVFDVVNQDSTAEQNTGLAGKVEPSSVDILSRYASQKFRAAGGAQATRFVIRQAQFQVHSTKVDNSWPASWVSDADTRAEMVATFSVMLSAANADGTSSTITANTTQSSIVAADLSPESARKEYLALMQRALDALDGEITKQLPVYFADVVAR